MWLFIISSISLLIISATMLARAHDLKWQKGWHWNIRLVGFILVGASCIGVIGAELWTRELPNIYETIFRLGLAMVFTTTPYMPPWWKWISGKDGDAVIEERRKNP